MRIRSHVLAAALLAAAAIAATFVLQPWGDHPALGPVADSSAARPLEMEIESDLPDRESAFETVRVRADVRTPRAYYDVSPEFRSASEGFEVTQPRTARMTRKGAGFPVDPAELERAAPVDGAAVAPPAARAPVGTGQVASFESTDFVDNISTTGSIFIPADPQGAAGPNHVVSVTNTTLAIHTKAGTLVEMEGIADFFAALSPDTFTFDPRVIYDHHAGRWLVITDEVTDRVTGAPSDTSRLFVAVSDDDDPTGQWTVTEIDARTTIGVPHWVDFPQLAVDEEAIYITGTMFRFASFGNASGGERLWIIEKGEGTGGFYDGGTALVDQYNPISGGAFDVAMTPAMVFGTPGSATFGTYLVGYSGLSNGVDEAVQLIRVNNPLGTPTFTLNLVIVGNIHDTSIFPLPEAQQSGSTVKIRANDSRALKAVWRGDNLWTTFAITPNIGDPERGQSAAHWVQFDVDGTVSVVQQGRVSGEDIAPGTHTFFPSLAVNEELDVMIGFAASGPAIFPGAYYAVHDATAGAGAIGPSMTLRAGIDFYVRTFNGTLNRWGDFSSVAVDPADQCFWIYNKYAMLRGTATGQPPQDGRWATRFAKFCNAECAGTPPPLTELVADNTPDTALSWEDLGSGFSYDVVIGTISVMRSEGMVGPAGCLAQQISTPVVVDTLPNPPAGEGRYYIVRPRSVCEIGDYGTDSDGVLRMPAPGCPD